MPSLNIQWLRDLETLEGFFFFWLCWKKKAKNQNDHKKHHFDVQIKKSVCKSIFITSFSRGLIKNKLENKSTHCNRDLKTSLGNNIFYKIIYYWCCYCFTFQIQLSLFPLLPEPLTQLLFHFYSENGRLTLHINQTWHIKLLYDLPFHVLRLDKTPTISNRITKASKRVRDRPCSHC